eukprot:1161529-Pelagomonas_calceolata.AAC.9
MALQRERKRSTRSKAYTKVFEMTQADDIAAYITCLGLTWDREAARGWMSLGLCGYGLCQKTREPLAIEMQWVEAPQFIFCPSSPFPLTALESRHKSIPDIPSSKSASWPPNLVDSELLFVAASMIGYLPPPLLQVELQSLEVAL